MGTMPVISLSAHHQGENGRTQEQELREALEQIELADQVGLDEVWLGEHRFSRHGSLSGIFHSLR